MKTLLAFCLIMPVTLLFGQKKTLDPSVYNNWKKNENQKVSNNGQFVTYEINPHKGDGYLYVYNILSEKLDSFPRGTDAQFSFESDYLAFKITPGFDTLRNCELNKVDKKKWPKDTLGVYIFSRDTLLKFALLKSFSTGEENNWLTYVLDDNTIKTTSITPDKSKKKTKKGKKDTYDGEYLPSDFETDLTIPQSDLNLPSDCKKKKKKAVEKPYKSDGKILTVWNPISEKKFQYKDVTDHVLSEKGEYLAIVEHKKEKTDSFQLQIISLNSGLKSEIFPKYTSVKSLTFNKPENFLAYHSSSDTNKVKLYNLNLYDLKASQNKILVDTNSFLIPSTDAVSENRAPLFTEDGRFLFFGVAQRPEKEVEDTLLDSEKVKLDVWHYMDKRLQPQQLVQLKRDQKKTDVYVYHFSDGGIVKLSNDTLKMYPKEKQIGEYLFASSDEQYALENQWEVPNREDHYRVSITDGSVELIKKAVGFNGDLSPSGNYYSYFDEKKSQFFLLDLNTRKETCITCSVSGVNWQSDINGMPMVAYPFGVQGYTRDEKDLILQSKYDLWIYNIENSKLISLTSGEGEQRKIKLQAKYWSYDSTYFEFENVYVDGLNEKTKGTHIFNLVDHGDHVDLVEKYYTDHKINLLIRSKNKESIVFRKMSVQDYPEVKITTGTFENEKTISSTNPQQVEYNWANVELVSWKSYDGTPLEGLLYKPEDFDPAKKYPLLIYYYELYSDDLHNHYVPKPTASIIYPTEYASAGYLVFIPDIRYKPGYPAKSAYNCIMSGTDHILKLVPAIDSTKMGLQGQSWGGYQTAQLITMTNRYAAAMAGAPVSNMFSAYGGIRWGSGVNRQFQYERTQSRIGKTIWEAPELYIENSPLFHIPNITTPLLIMHNDKDGAVPWYQGIEMFNGMKRLGKPCWLLNYNGDDHNLMQNANRMDLSIRMKQFFDHYLMGKPAPKWILEGIPATVKGKELRYE